MGLCWVTLHKMVGSVLVLSLQAMQCLVQLASVRRSLFSSDENRVQYLVSLVTISVELMKRSQGNQRVDFFFSLSSASSQSNRTAHHGHEPYVPLCVLVKCDLNFLFCFACGGLDTQPCRKTTIVFCTFAVC